MKDKIYNLLIKNWDIIAHALLSCIAVTILMAVMPWWGAALITLSVGLIKEFVMDEKWDYRDIIADVVGITLGVL